MIVRICMLIIKNIFLYLYSSEFWQSPFRYRKSFQEFPLFKYYNHLLFHQNVAESQNVNKPQLHHELHLRQLTAKNTVFERKIAENLAVGNFYCNRFSWPNQENFWKSS